ncbi:hypothetical protein FRC00_012459 [Tulasnella sp. 408]|nr:hypothetical protein FRC00_012459 [Tulasnella sp. 408]
MLATVGLSILLFGSSPALSAATGPVNKGLVAFGYIPANARESTGDTLGGIGSAIALRAGSFAKGKDGTFKGTLVVQPDRGYNVDETVDYQGRHHYVNFVLKPYYGTASLSFADAAKTLQLSYKKTILYKDRKGKATTGLDPVSVRPASGGDPILPVPNVKTKNQISLDSEGLVLNRDGSFWISDEYGPYIYRFSEKGHLLDVIQPPPAAIPRIGGAVNFTSFEGLTASPDGHKLYAMLQSSTMQDGGTDDTTSRYTRLFVYDVNRRVPKLIGEYVLGRFGLHNGGDFDQQLIAGKWEGTALASCQESKYPDDYFLFVAADNDFNTLDGTMVGQPYSTSYGKDVDNQFLVYRVTLPMVPRGSIH